MAEDLPDEPPWRSEAEPPPGHGTLDDRRWAVLTHLSIFGAVIAVPLAVVLWKDARSPYVCHHAAEALNFQTTVLLAVLFCSLTSVLLVGALLLPLVLVGAATLAVREAMHSHRGAWHRYPFTLRFVR